MRHRVYRYLVLVLLVTCNTACAPRSPDQPAAPTAQPQPLLGSCALQLPPGTADEAAIRAVLAAEGALVVEQDIALLMQLWREGAQITDAKHTALDPADDQQWLDKDAIRHRYLRLVFPGAPTVVTPKDLMITLDHQRATITATTQIGNEVSPAGDRWVLAKQRECWVIESLTYNLESPTN
jgi:hypothetical protein